MNNKNEKEKKRALVMRENLIKRKEQANKKKSSELINKTNKEKK